MHIPEHDPESREARRLPADRVKGLLEWAYRISIRVGFAKLLIGIVLAAIVIAVALAVPIWGYFYGVPANQVVVVTVTVALFTATPLGYFLVYVIMKEEATRQELFESNEVLRKEREVQSDTLKELRIARDSARAANDAKTQFLANMSHELRTPLNAVIGFSEVIAKEIRGQVGNPEYVSYAEAINESGTHLLELINDILDVARIEVGGYKLNEEVVDVATIAASSLRLIEPRARGARMELRSEVAEDLPMLRCDPRAVKQMLLNLLANAVTFTPPEGRITLAARRRPQGGLVLEVTDTGIGMSEEEIPYAMARFSQVEDSYAKEHQGVGLGLTLTNDLIRLHGGSLSIASKLDVGTTVSLSFPPERCDDAESACPGTTATAAL